MTRFTYVNKGRKIVVHEVDELAAIQARQRIEKQYFPDLPGEWKLKKVETPK